MEVFYKLEGSGETGRCIQLFRRHEIPSKNLFAVESVPAFVDFATAIIIDIRRHVRRTFVLLMEKAEFETDAGGVATVNGAGVKLVGGKTEYVPHLQGRGHRVFLDHRLADTWNQRQPYILLPDVVARRGAFDAFEAIAGEHPQRGIGVYGPDRPPAIDLMMGRAPPGTPLGRQ